MEGRAHSSHTYINDVALSRMNNDLKDCSDDFVDTFKPRPAIRARACGQNNKSPVHVGVIGAGIAGLRCSEVLLDQGCKVTLLEARDRIGGRVGSHAIMTGPF